MNNNRKRPDKGRKPSALSDWCRRWLPIGLVSGLSPLGRSENQVDYRYENYVEENDRVRVQTHAVYFEQKLLDAVTAKGELVYDSISGATPTGTHDASGHVLLSDVSDIRRAISTQFDCRLAAHTLTPGFAYSHESDYTSYAVSLNEAWEFNDKNTTLQLGLSHNFDDVRMADGKTWKDKQSTAGILGVSQLLSPTTVFTAAVTFANDSGYLSDPYRLAEYHPDGFPSDVSIGVPERRPSHRNKWILLNSLTHYFTSLDASLEGSYRFYYDSFSIVSHTVEVGWHQWLLGRHLMLEPVARFSQQSAASFYTTRFSGPFDTDPSGFHSSDYRLSELYTIDLGLKASVVITDHFRVVLGYNRYEMHGMDGKTSNAMYPKANIYTAGISILW
jgi:hypothetical protein